MLKHIGTQKIETPRLILQQFQVSDADDMYTNWVTDPEVAKFWSWQPHKCIGETKALLSRWAESYLDPETYHWVIRLKSNCQAVGYIYFSDIDTPGGSLSVHYALSRRLWGRGLMPEACSAAIGFAFDALGAERVHSHHHIDNTASGRVMEKCGMQYLKTACKSIPGCPRISGDYRFYEIRRPEL